MTPEWLASVPRPENLPDLGRQAAAVAHAHGVALPLTVAKDIALAVLHLSATCNPTPNLTPNEAPEVGCDCRVGIVEWLETQYPNEYPPGSALARRTRKENP